MATIKISKEEIVQMIKEEYSKKLTEIKLKNRLNQINEEIQQIVSEDMEEEGLEEVKAGGKTETVGPDGVSKGEKFKPVFEKKGSHLVEEDLPGEEKITSDELPSEELPGEEKLEDDLDITEILGKLADAIEDKIEITVDEKMGEEKTDTTEELPDNAEELPDNTEEMPGENEEDIVKEQDGTSVAQGQEVKDGTTYGEKANIRTNKEADQLVSESTKKRMQILSGIRKNDFNE